MSDEEQRSDEQTPEEAPSPEETPAAEEAAAAEEPRGRGASALRRRPRPRRLRAEEPAAEDAPESDEAPAAEEAPQPRSPPPRRPAEPKAEHRADAGDKKEKKPEVVPGAELDPIAIEPERELSAEERARREAEEEERARREAELIGGRAEDAPLAAKPAKLSGDARFLATGKRKSSVARVIAEPGQRHDRGQQAQARGVLPAVLPAVGGQAAAGPDRLRGQRRRARARARRRHLGPGRRGPPRHRPGPLRRRPELRPELKRRGMLTRDARVKERRKAGLKKARKSRSSPSAEPPGRWRSADSSAPTGSGGAVGDFLTADLAMRLGRAAALAAEAERPQVADHPRHPRVGPDARGRPRGRDRLGRRRRDARRRAADAGGLGPRPPARLRPRGGRLGLAQPLRRQRHQVLRALAG